MTDKVIYVRISREPMPACACGVFHSVEGQETRAEQVVQTTGYGAAPTFKARRALLERDRLTVAWLSHIAREGSGLWVMVSTPQDVLDDLVTRGLVSYCHKHDRYNVTMVGTGLAWTWVITDAEVTKIERRVLAFRRLARAYAQAARMAARTDHPEGTGPA